MDCGMYFGGHVDTMCHPPAFFFSSTGGYGHLSVNHYITSTPRLSFPFFLFLDFKVLYHKVLIRIIAKKKKKQQHFFLLFSAFLVLIEFAW